MTRPGKRSRDGETEVVETSATKSGSLQLKIHQIIKLVAVSQYLPTKDLGRLVLCTSKSTTAALCDKENSPEDVYKLLLFSKMGTEKANSFLRSTRLSAQKCFFAFVLGQESKPTTEFELRTLKNTPEDYVIVMILEDLVDEGPYICKTLPRDIKTKFLETGEILIDFSKPVEWPSRKGGDDCQMIDMKVRISIVYRNKVVCLGETRYNTMVISQEEGYIDEREFHRRVCKFECSTYACTFLDRYASSELAELVVVPWPQLECHQREDTLGGDGGPRYVDLTGISLESEVKGSCLCCDEEYMGGILESSKCKRDGITFAHFLELIDGLADQA